jgi:hypothetical protein
VGPASSALTLNALVAGTLAAVCWFMTSKRHNMTLGTFALSAFVGAAATGCSEGEPQSELLPQQTDPSFAREDGATPTPDDEPDSGASTSDSACIACPRAFGGSCTARNLSLQPGYDAVRAEWLASCPTDESQSDRPTVSEARCGTSGLHYLHISYGLGAERRYFDAEGRFVSVMTESDFIDAVCVGRRYWPVRTECEAESERESLCSSTGTRP